MTNFTRIKSQIYYSQNREDLILQAFFPDVKRGFYVDVGAYDPDYDSVTKLFYLQRWHGINIEPQLNRYKVFVKKRTRDINLNVGVSNKKGKLTLRSYKNQGLSTFSDNMKAKYVKQPDASTRAYQDFKVKVVALENIFAKHAKKQIHFMKIDVEGLEHEVLESNDWQKYRPEVLCIEANHAAKNWGNLLATNNYQLVFFDGLNKYYADSRTNRKSIFDYVKHVLLDKAGGIRSNDYAIIDTLRKEKLYSAKLLAQADVELKKKAVENSVLKDENITLEHALARAVQKLNSMGYAVTQVPRLIAKKAIKKRQRNGDK